MIIRLSFHFIYFIFYNTLFRFLFRFIFEESKPMLLLILEKPSPEADADAKTDFDKDEGDTVIVALLTSLGVSATENTHSLNGCFHL
ncbi:MAG: hypothetical protein ACI8RD_003737 [Bacillariaceae sp.]|jgi:hypothetical protein